MNAASTGGPAKRLCLALAPVVCALSALIAAQPASAAPAPHWKVSSRSAPLYLPLQGEQLVAANDQHIKGEGVIVAFVTNLGSAAADGSKEQITVTDQLPSGLHPTAVRATSGQGIPGNTSLELPLTCAEPFKENKVVCTFDKSVPSYEHLELRISVTSEVHAVEAPKVESEDPNVITVTGGGAPEGKVEQKLKFGADEEVSGKKLSRTHFGVEQYEFVPEDEQGNPDTEAGSHPFQLTTTFYLNETFGFNKESSESNLPQAPGLQKNLNFRIPAGVLGNPNAVPQCSDFDFGVIESGGRNACPDDTAIGVVTVAFIEPSAGLGFRTWTLPVFNLVPSPGEPAKFGFEVTGVPIVLDTSLRTGEDYGVTVSVRETSEAVEVLGARVTLWGTPGDPVHDQARGWDCLESGRYVEGLNIKCGEKELSNPTPFIILPTSCAESLKTTASGDSWSGEEFAVENEPPLAEKPPVKLTGCEKLPFNPSLTVSPESSSASTPSGFNIELSLPQQETTMKPSALGEADIRETTLALPQGVQASAGAANGLEVCGASAAGLLNPDGQTPAHDSDTGGVLEAQLAAQRFTPVAATCPTAEIEGTLEERSKIGEVVINTPLLPHPVTGGLYLGIQNTNPFTPPLVAYLLATEEEPRKHEWSKILIKLAGEVEICQTVQVGGPCKEVGQLVSRFKNTPQAPFEHLKIHLLGGARASQATPPRCGNYTTSAQLKPWPEGVSSVEAKSTFAITSGAGGGPCPGATLPFAPSFVGGATNTQAGAFTPFTIVLAPRDGDQALTGLSMRLPQGAAAMLASVTPCPVALADAGQCPQSSLIGHSLTSSGLGGSPVTLGGEAFLTESLRPGAPFGVSVLTNAEHVGPFNIGKIIANSTIQVDPNTAAATITAVETRILESRREGKPPHLTEVAGLPTMIKGVPVQLKRVIVNVDRPNFEFNPTDCSGHSITGAPTAISDTLTGAEGGSASAQTPYAVTGCASLNFTPKLTASVVGPGSKPNGTTFSVVVEAARGQANIAKTFLQLPVQLPSRLSTIQQACLAKVFEENPAKCDEGSNIGFAVAKTPVLKKPLSGPAYLVSHGNAAFPDVEFVLQSEGVEVVLDGKTDIKAGITYSRFETVPDAPVERFETVLPAGPHSALTANVPESEHFNLCKHAAQLVVPTEITGQNGVLIRQETKVALIGCGGVASFCVAHKTTSKCKLQLALEACKHKYKGNSKSTRKKRATCEAQARKKYGPKKKSSKHKAKHK
jgi:hypothetical protein